MKLIKFIPIFFLAQFFLTVSAQSIQGTIRAGSGANSVFVSMKPTANITGSLTDFQFTIAIPVSAVVPAPTYSFTPLIAGVTLGATAQTVTIEIVGGVNSYVYTFSAVGTGVASATYDPAITYNVVELFFGGSAPGVTTSIRMVQLPAGGLTGQSNFFVAFNNNADATNPAAPFFGTGASSDGQSYNGFSFVPLGNVTLPTKFSHFLAIKKDDNADLTWTVETEENNAYFDVQRSLDGRTFTNVIRVNAFRNGRTSNTYTTPDVNISRLGSKVIYYRIKQVETSGEITFSEVRQVNLDKKNFSIGLYPNPVVSNTKLVVDAPQAGKAFIIIRDASGKTVQQINMEFVKGINQKDLNASMLPAGEYNVTVMSEKFSQTIKLTKGN